MPSIAKQSVRPPPRTVKGGGSAGVLDRIAPVRGSNLGRMKVSIYGNPKTGKTRLSCTFPAPGLLIGTEDGTASVAGAEGWEYVLLKATDELTDVIQSAASGRWKSVVLDNGTGLRSMRIAELWASRGGDVPAKKPFIYADKAWKEVWNQAGDDWRRLVRPLLDLPNRVDVNVVVIAHEQSFGGYDEDSGPSGDVIQPAVGSALGKSLCMWLNAECDYICQTFIREAMRDREKTVKIGGKVKKQIERVKTGKKEFCLRIGPHETYITGFRLPLGRQELPDVIVDPSYDKITKLIEG